MAVRRNNMNDAASTAKLGSKLVIQKATKEGTKARIAISGVSGSGKTYSSLQIATGLAGKKGKICFIDSENKSARKYADRFNFDVIDLPKKNILTYGEAIDVAADAGYDVLIIDSMSHAWDELVEEVNRLSTSSKFRGNTWAAWSYGTPKQRAFIQHILDFPGHVICCFRVKTEWVVDEVARNRPVKVGLAPISGKGIEFEFDINLEIDSQHNAMVSKDRTGRWQDQMIEKPDAAFGWAIAEWLTD